MRVRCFAFALAMALSAGVANANVILTFDDSTPTPSVTVSGGSAQIVMVSPTNFLAILPAGTLPTAPSGMFNDVFGLLAPGTLPAAGFSDLVYTMSIPNSTSVLVDFVATSGTPLTPSSGSNLYGTATTTGTVQTIPNSPNIAGAGLTIQFIAGGGTTSTSPQAVPEPSMLALGAIGGVLGLGVWGYRRRRGVFQA
jgi:hypothetical protein